MFEGVFDLPVPEKTVHAIASPSEIEDTGEITHEMMGDLSKVMKSFKLPAEASCGLSKGKLLRASGVHGLCMRQAVYEALDSKREPCESRFPMTSLFAMDAGTALHETIQDRILGPMRVLHGYWTTRDGKEKRLGFWHEMWPRYEEYSFRDGELCLAGHTDGVICLERIRRLKAGKNFDGLPMNMYTDPCHLEIKSTNDRNFKHTKSGNLPDYYRWQANVYQMFLEVDKTMFLYMNRDNGSLCSFIYQGSDKLKDAIKEKAATFKKYRDAEAIPHEKYRKCPSINSKDAKCCPFRRRCFGA